VEAANRRRPQRKINGIFLLDKPVGISSNGALQQVKRAFGARKAGHTGNLDVLATGLLPICFGEATKVCAFLLDADKRYIADIKLGEVTETGDSEGEVIRRVERFSVDIEAATRVAANFTGEIEQVPPMYSALKQDGQRLYKLARQGIEVERKPRKIVIRSLSVTGLHEGILSIDVSCSKGTYIRTLAEDIGDALGCGAHVKSLRRTEAGPFSIEAALSVSQVHDISDGVDSEAMLDEKLLPLDRALINFPDIELSEEMAFSITRGQAVRIADAPVEGFVRLYRPKREFIGVGAVLEDGRIAPRRMMA
jgi:tRNA pseudouridine55 synthase